MLTSFVHANTDIGPDKHILERKSVIIFLSTHLNKCFGCSKRTVFNETLLLSTDIIRFGLWLRNKKICFSSFNDFNSTGAPM